MVRNDKILDGLARDMFPKKSIAHNACVAGAEAIRKVENMSQDTRTITLGEYQEYMRLKMHQLFVDSIAESGDPVDWAVYKSQPNILRYLKEHGINSNSSLTDRQIMAISFAHAFENKIIDYIVKLEEFNND